MPRRFVADVMLGRLAKRMRFAGYDVEYDSAATDDALLKKTRGRILLTRDLELSQRARPARVYFVLNTGAPRQFAEIRAQFPDDSSGTRCIECNRKIRKIHAKKVEHLVPPFVFRRYHQFHICPLCRRVYWEGTHFERLSRIMK